MSFVPRWASSDLGIAFGPLRFDYAVPLTKARTIACQQFKSRGDIGSEFDSRPDRDGWNGEPTSSNNRLVDAGDIAT